VPETAQLAVPDAPLDIVPDAVQQMGLEPMQEVVAGATPERAEYVSAVRAIVASVEEALEEEKIVELPQSSADVSDSDSHNSADDEALSDNSFGRQCEPVEPLGDAEMEIEVGPSPGAHEASFDGVKITEPVSDNSSHASRRVLEPLPPVDTQMSVRVARRSPSAAAQPDTVSIREPRPLRTAQSARAIHPASLDTSFMNAASYSDEEIRRMYIALVSKKKSPEAEALPHIRQWVQSEMRNAIFETRYEDGQQLEAAEEMIRELMTAEEDTELRQQRRRKAVQKLAELGERAREIAQAWNDRIERWNSDQSARLAAIESSHQTQIARFEAQWEDPAYLIRFNKLSSQAIVRRRYQQQFAALREFQQALQMKTEAERLERQEAIVARERAIATMQLEYDTLIARQNRELECFHAFTDRVVKTLEKDRDRDLAPIGLIRDRLSAFLSTKPRRERRKDGIFLNPGTPRSGRRIRVVDRPAPPPTLPLSGIQVRKYLRVKPKKPII
jgi:hypothetical protein